MGNAEHTSSGLGKEAECNGYEASGTVMPGKMEACHIMLCCGGCDVPNLFLYSIMLGLA